MSIQANTSSRVMTPKQGDASVPQQAMPSETHLHALNSQHADTDAVLDWLTYTAFTHDNNNGNLGKIL